MRTSNKQPPSVRHDWDPDTWVLRVWIDGELETHKDISPFFNDQLWKRRRNRGRFLSYLKKITKGSS
jgi:hypothetical protein